MKECKLPLIDFHTHLPLKDPLKAKLLNSMDTLEIESSVVIPGGVISCQLLSQQMNYGGGQDVNAPNLELLEFCKNEERLLPFYFASPHQKLEEYVQYGKHFYG